MGGEEVSIAPEGRFSKVLSIDVWALISEGFGIVSYDCFGRRSIDRKMYRPRSGHISCYSLMDCRARRAQ